LLQENNVNLTTRILASASLLALTLTIPSALAAPAPAAGESTVVYSTPNDVLVKRADGQYINYTLPAGAAITVAGKKVPAGDVKPGTKLSGDLPGDSKVVTAISIVKGKIYQVDPPDKVTLSLSSGIKELTIPTGTTFTVGGKKVPVSDLKKDMDVEATVISTLPGSDATGNIPPDAPPARAGVILLDISEGAYLPPAGTNLPLFGILGCLAIALGFALRSNRFPRIKI
jgi:hypothetical protein